ncbi:VCBS repeat-containing protein [Aquimarina rubra]|uniref:VCBS repeat-containing protein n=1 Tax=Aquimarina rubra TaxID=1920033 RepID=A0ABW5L8P6_9FLAO
MKKLICFILIAIVCACKTDQSYKKQIISIDATTKKPTLFELQNPESSGFYFLNEVNQTDAINIITYENYYNGGGVGIGDVNNDGLPDVFMTGNLFGGRLFLNKGDLKFEQISESAGVFSAGFTTDVTFVDINNDGYQDIYLCKSLSSQPDMRKNVLLINNKDNTFTNQADVYGIADNGYSNQSVFFDYDHDGDLDLYIMNHRADFDKANHIFDSKEKKGNITPDHVFWNEAYADRLYRNDGNKKFTEVSKKAGIINSDFSLSAVPKDLNNDGWVDLYISNDFSSKDHAYINQKDGTFKDEIETIFNHIPVSAMGLDIADINNDGLEDVMNVDMTPEDNYRRKQLKGRGSYDKYHLAKKYGFYHQITRNMLHLNNGDGTYSEIGQLAGIAYTDWSWSTLFADFDNDGWQDIYVSNGHYNDITDQDYLKYRSVEAIEKAGGNDQVKPLDLINLMTSTKINNYFYKNTGSLQFEDRTVESGLGFPSYSNGSAYADLDLDGDLDLIVNNFNQESFLFKNTSREKQLGNYLSISLKGSQGNSLGFGATVTIKTADGQQIRTSNPYRGFISSVDPNLHFGLGKITEIDELEVIWPEGKRQVLNNIKANQRIVLNFTEAAEYKREPIEIPEPLITTSKDNLIYTHKESSYQDFKAEPLLEHKLSNEGPVIASADINGDGLNDLYIGGSAQQPGKLFVQKRDEKFIEKNTPIFNDDQKYEDGGCAFFDIDGDGDNDLYVSSGSNEFSDASLYQDRLYINDGKGNFTKGVLPNITTSTSCVIPFDHDQDGDFDIFIGGYANWNAYPTAGKSWLLENDNGTFTDKSALLPNQGQLGIINSGVVFSSNSLIVAGEWTPIMHLKKDTSGQFKMSENNGLSKTGGWWNIIRAADMDNDGDLDLIAGNRGTNSVYNASAKHPAVIYWGDFDNNKDLDAITCYYFPKDSATYPKANLDKLFNQMKSIRRTFQNYDSYSKASLETIIPDRSQYREVHYFESIYLENVGDDHFQIQALPKKAQFAPIQDVLVKDINQDTFKDLILVGNDFGVDEESGISNASKGLVLINKKDSFQALNSLESGLNTYNMDSRHIVLINEKLFAVTNNNGPLQFFEIIKN